MAHGVVRIDNAMGTTVPTYLKSVKYGSAANAESLTKVDNGRIVKLDREVEGLRDVYYALDQTTVEAIGKVIAVEQAGLLKYFVVEFYKDVDALIIASPEVMREDNLSNLSDFYNAKGVVARAYNIHEKDTFGFTSECIDGTIAKGDEVIASNGKIKKKEE